VLAGREHIGIAGISMGGYGAVKTALIRIRVVRELTVRENHDDVISLGSFHDI
jgi:S-formylglutathione hydrolase FrmB